MSPLMSNLEVLDLRYVGLTRPPNPNHYIHAQPKLHKISEHDRLLSACPQHYRLISVQNWMNTSGILTPQNVYPCLWCFGGKYGTAIIHSDRVAIQWVVYPTLEDADA